MVTHILGLRLHGTTLILPAGRRRAALSSLTRVQSASAGVLGAFGVVHLSAPLVGLLYGVTGDMNDRVDAASRWMLLGRVAYQSAVGEAVVWAALGVHLAAGLAKRLITRFTVASPAAGETEVASSKAKLTWAQSSGWLLAPFALHHAIVNRVLPASGTAPISSLSPSELDYSFVAHSLSHPNLPVRAAMGAAYTLLSAAFAVHVAYAVPALLRSLPLRKSSSTQGTRMRKRRSKAQVAASLAVVLLASVASMVPLANDGLLISGTLRKRYDAVLGLAWPTRFFLHSR
ncbi:hypothetical protein EX895_000874 [Sporisorium graminicola]|uniref:Mitochondrial adapter protein MCP1 transmembrane domain-containing protein n=1 Tax=Sporisorium graminicola TaxID=280036 RepID=A0A4U7L262_9BASI|nr:hypothetical protein EX895_000874 [Sporisorium graminicola]TKY90876.1 hypothetical protein EX895_000874 [Sporisorium graminicola]